MRTPLAFLVSLAVVVLAACGGGSSGVDPNATPTPTATPSPSPTPTGDARTQEMLQDCLPSALDGATSWLEAMQRVVAGTGAAAGVAILPGGVTYSDDPDTPFLDVQWSYDPDGDMNPDGIGGFHFVDAAGSDVQPFSPAGAAALQASESIADFGSLYLPTVPDGTHMLVDYNAPPPAEPNLGVLDVTFTGGVAGTTDGSLDVTTPACGVGFTWTGITLANLQGNLATTFPTGTWSVSITADADTLQGTLTMVGTRTATASVSRDGAPATAWSIDLVTGDATQQ